MMIVSLWFIKGKTPEEKKNLSKKWTMLAILAFVFSGMAGVMEKIHQSTEAKTEKLPFVFVACAVMFAFSIVLSLATRKKEEKVSIRSTLSVAAVSGLVIGLYSTVNLTLSGNLDSMIYYPIANGGAMLLTVLVSVVIFNAIIHDATNAQSGCNIPQYATIAIYRSFGCTAKAYPKCMVIGKSATMIIGPILAVKT
jgi:FtsH-binding integral membrane protein